MKNFEYAWNQDIFLLHVQFSNIENNENVINLKRIFKENDEKVELINFEKTLNSHRIIVSRSHPKEKGILIEYPKNINIEVSEVDDRAYYPTTHYYKD